MGGQTLVQFVFVVLIICLTSSETNITSTIAQMSNTTTSENVAAYEELNSTSANSTSYESTTNTTSPEWLKITTPSNRSFEQELKTSILDEFTASKNASVTTQDANELVKETSTRNMVTSTVASTSSRTLPTQVSTAVYENNRELSVECTSIEDCYGYNVRAWSCTSGKCIYKKATYTMCYTAAQCQEVLKDNTTFCASNTCFCEDGKGISYYLPDVCSRILSPSERWKYETSRQVQAIASRKPWTISHFVMYELLYICLLLSIATAAILAVIVEWCRQRQKERPAEKEKELTTESQPPEAIPQPLLVVANQTEAIPIEVKEVHEIMPPPQPAVPIPLQDPEPSRLTAKSKYESTLTLVPEDAPATSFNNPTLLPQENMEVEKKVAADSQQTEIQTKEADEEQPKLNEEGTTITEPDKDPENTPETLPEENPAESLIMGLRHFFK